MRNKLETVIQNAELLKRAIVVDCAVYVVDLDGIIRAYVPADYMRASGIKSLVGEPMPQSSPAIRCLTTRQREVAVLPQSAFGYSVKSNAYPVCSDDGEFIGVIGTSMNINIHNTLKSSSQNVAAAAEEVSCTIEAMGTIAISLSQELHKIKISGDQLRKEITRTDEILKIVSAISSDSNLLGLNAAIVAARAQEQGRAFAVVAEEIRKMASTSARSVSDIKKILRSISQEVDAVIQAVVTTAEMSEQQSTGMEEIASSMQLLTSAASEVEIVANDL